MKNLISILEIENAVEIAKKRAREKYYYSLVGFVDREHSRSSFSSSCDVKDGRFSFFFEDGEDCNKQFFEVPISEEEYSMTEERWAENLVRLEQESRAEHSRQVLHYKTEEAKNKHNALKYMQEMLNNFEKSF